MEYIDVATNFETISNYAERMINRFKQLREIHPDMEFQVKGSFNGVNLFVYDDSTVKSIVADYDMGLERNIEEYKKTDEYKESEIKRKEETKRLQLADDDMDKIVSEYCNCE